MAPLQALGSSAALCGTPLQGRPGSASRRASARGCSVRTEAASSKATKGETLARLATKVQPEAQTVFIAGVNFKGFTVRGGWSGGAADWRLCARTGGIAAQGLGLPPVLRAEPLRRASAAAPRRPVGRLRPSGGTRCAALRAALSAPMRNPRPPALRRPPPSPRRLRPGEGL